MIGKSVDRPSIGRPKGPLRAATQSTGRPMAEVKNPQLQLSNVYNGNRGPGLTAIRRAGPGTASSVQIARSEASFIALAREAMAIAIEENKSKAEEASGVSQELRPGVTIDLSHKQIHKFPNEVVDIIKNELERLALSHNLISSLPTRFSECASLRYLNMRSNVIREFPLAICQLSSLEILDLGRNKLRTIPPEVGKLTSLKVFSVQKNRIEELSLCLANMTSLVSLKLEGNPIRFPPREILQPRPISSPNRTLDYDDDIAITAQIKKFLKQRAISERSETESGGEESSEGTETPRPLKRATGRFPIKVNGTEVPDMRSPGLPRPPPIPSRSHYRGLSQQNAAARRPGVVPLTIGNANERVRSNSEGLSQSRADRSSDKSKRLGIIQRKNSDLDVLEESKLNRHSHYRGLSHGSAMQGPSAGINAVNVTRSPASPADSISSRATYVRRLSSLPERKRESLYLDPVIEGAKGVLYAIFQVHPLIQTLLGLARDGSNKRTKLERVFYNSHMHVDQLDRDLQAFDNYSEEDEETAPRSNEGVYRACLTCVTSYLHICSLLSGIAENLIRNSDPRYIRTLLLLTYGSVAEIRNAGASLLTPRHSQFNGAHQARTEARALDSKNKCVTPTRGRPGTSVSRARGTTTVVNSMKGLKIGVDTPTAPYAYGRTITMTSATPQSGESFASSNASGNIVANPEFTEEDRMFEQIFLRLQQSSDMAVKTLPLAGDHFITLMKLSNDQNHSDLLKQYWHLLRQKSLTSLDTAELLKRRLSSIKLKEPGMRSQRSFWELCNTFVENYTELLIKVKEVKAVTSLLPNDLIVVLRPLQRAIKETAQLIQTSPWAYLAGRQVINGMSNADGVSSSSPSVAQPMLRLTPQNVALGPAAQATVPSTPQSASFPAPMNKVLSGNFFERADAFLATNGPYSALSSRCGTMNSSFNSSDGGMTPSSHFSPANSMSSRSKEFNSRDLKDKESNNAFAK